jgi:hypothetical protein
MRRRELLGMEGNKDMGFGVLTLATRSDYRKAIGLALSVRVSNPGVPVAVACSKEARQFVVPYFDHVIDQDRSLHRFEHKLHLDRYSPFDETFYFDSDVLVFRPLSEVIADWRRQPYAACGKYATEGISAFGLDTEAVLRVIGHNKMVKIDGAGHAYFRKPDCVAVFDLAREIASNYHFYAGEISLADEDVMNIVMTKMGLVPIPHVNFWSLHCTAKPGSLKMNVAEGKCSLERVFDGKTQHPYMMHFAAREAPFFYARQLWLLFKKFGVGTNGLMLCALRDYYIRDVNWRAKRAARTAFESAMRKVNSLSVVR